MSRTGDPRELLFGPTQYGLVFAAVTLLHWRSVPAVVALAALCFGDATAELASARGWTGWGRGAVPLTRSPVHRGGARRGGVGRHWGMTRVLWARPGVVKTLAGSAGFVAAVTGLSSRQRGPG